MIKYIAMMISLLLFPAACNSTPPVETDSPGETIALVNARIIDGTGSTPIEKGTVLIIAGKISAVGAGSGIPIPKDARVVDAQGCTVLPGVFNAHVHSGYSDSNLKAWAYGGVTTVRELGTYYSRGLFKQRDRFLADNTNARLISAGPFLTVRGGYPIAIFNSDTGLPLNSLRQIRKKVTALLDEGADLLKISLESGRIWRKNLPGFNEAELNEIVSLGHQRGKKISAHLLSSQDVKRAVTAGVDDISHMAVTEELDDSLVKQVVDKGMYWVPTLELFTCINPRFLRQAIENLRKFHRAGGHVALGTDYGGYTCEFQLGMPVKEMRLMKQAGMSNMEIIVSATLDAARVCGVDKRLGSLETGKIADVIAVSGNPLEHIDDMANVRLVIKNGRIIRNEL